MQNVNNDAMLSDEIKQAGLHGPSFFPLSKVQDMLFLLLDHVTREALTGERHSQSES